VRVSDPFDLRRFVDAQAPVYAAALQELRDGYKRTHWMWFVFPQIAGLSLSPTGRRFALSGLPEAKAYVAHPLLGLRLVECSTVLTQLKETDPVQIFGSIDALKLRSSMTLFSVAEPERAVFVAVLERYFGGATDQATLDLIG
jgi:uncharacterized protein (DUF1810 family)